MGILRGKSTVGCAEENTTPSVLDSSSKPAPAPGPGGPGGPRRRIPRISKKDRSVSTESGVYHAALTLRASWKEYCNSAAIHGVRYFVEDGRQKFERVFWVLSLALSLAGCFFLIMRVYIKWNNTPVIVTFAETSTPIWHVPFPAVSVCPETKSRQTVFNYTDVYNRHYDYEHANRTDTVTNITDVDPEDLDYLEALSFICRTDYLTNGKDEFPLRSMEILEKVAPPMSEAIIWCQWQGHECTETFTPIMSDEGLCYTFNMLSNHELYTPSAVQYNDNDTVSGGRESEGWDLEHGYPEAAGLDTYPLRALGNGPRAGLVIMLRTFRPDCDYLCSGAEQGFKVLLHNPAELPRIGQQYFRAPLDQEVVVVVKPSMITTTEGLQDYAPARRQCYFSKERHLQYFNVYTQKNCELECATNYTMNMCNCTAFYMPRSANYPVCGTNRQRCLEDATEKLVLHEIQRSRERQKGNFSADDCDCLPSCTSLEYDTETSQADSDWTNVFQAARMSTDFVGEGAALTQVTIYFKDTQFITSRRSELYGKTDFLASCGGLLGLFSGFSLISLIEIVYYLSIRLWCNVHRARKRRAKALAEMAALNNLAIAGPFDVEKQQPPQEQDEEEEEEDDKQEKEHQRPRKG